jgi:hypothetical protein
VAAGTAEPETASKGNPALARTLAPAEWGVKGNPGFGGNYRNSCAGIGDAVDMAHRPCGGVGLAGEDRGERKGEAGQEWARQRIRGCEDGDGEGRSLVQPADLDGPDL